MWEQSANGVPEVLLDVSGGYRVVESMLCHHIRRKTCKLDF